MTIKIALAQIEILAGQPQGNLKTILETVAKAKKSKADILILPEMAIPGYMLGDLWEYEYFLHECEDCGRQLIEASDSICIIFGNVAINWNKKGEDGRVRKYNACFVAQNKKLIYGNMPYPFYIKTTLPNYRQFEDSRHFYSNTALAYELGKSPDELISPYNVTIKGEKISLGCMICEDGWMNYHPVKQPDVLAQRQPDIFINISSSPYHLGKNTLRQQNFSSLCQKNQLPLLYLNHTGIQDTGKNIYAYDGASCVYDKEGQVIGNCQNFEQELLYVDYDTKSKTFSTNQTIENQSSEVEKIFTTIKYSLTNFLKQNNITKMTVGLSGGIDSAVSAAIYTHILGPKNVLLINMPGKYNSNTTIGLAKQLAQNLDANYAVIPVEKSIKLTTTQVQLIDIEGKKLSLSDFALENVQARDRSSRILAAAASAFGSPFSCNSNKSEITVGYGTFYGDLAGAVAILGDLWKHQVYALGHYLNEEIFAQPVIPEEVFKIMPSAELSPEQTIGTGGDPLCYPYHDYLFKSFTERKLSPVEISLAYKEEALEAEIGCEEGLVAKLFPTDADFFADLEKWWLLMGGLAIAKRIQSPPIIAVSSSVFGSERREAQILPSLPMEYLKIKKSILKNSSAILEQRKISK